MAMQIIRECRIRAAILTSIAKDAPELEIQLLYVAKEHLTLAIIIEPTQRRYISGGRVAVRARACRRGVNVRYWPKADITRYMLALVRSS